MRFRFGEFTVDPATHELWRRGELVVAQPKVLALVAHLACNPNRLVSREELDELLWPDVHVGEDSLNQAVRRARAVLGDHDHALLCAVPRRGYRFVADVQVVDDGPESPAAPRIAPAPRGRVGRDEELARLDALLRERRLVTIVGPAGAGKTHLARCWGETCPDPAWFVDLTAARSGAEVLAGVARALGVDVRRGPDALDAALHARGRVVLVLDNLEQVLEEGAALVTRWLDAAPRARILVTSRERLRTRAEEVLELDVLPSTDAVTVLAVRASSAGGAERWRADAPVLPELAERLDRLPLALELAAAWARVLGPDEVLERLSRRFALLSRGARDADARHATLYDAIDWSWSLLEPAEREALAQCSVFRGGFSLALAERTLSGGDVVERLSRLVDKSVVAARAGRFHLLESIREFAAGHHARDPEWADTLRRWHEALLELCEPLSRRDHVEGIAAELPNLLAAADDALERGEPRTAARLVLVIESAVYALGPLEQNTDRLERAAALGIGAVGPELYVRLTLARQQRRTGAEATELAEAAAWTAREHGLPALQCRAESAIALAAARTGDHAGCEQALEALLARVPDGDEGDEVRGMIHVNLTLATYHLNRPADAERHCRAALEVLPERCRSLRTNAMMNLASMASAAGDLDRAEAALNEALRLANELGRLRSPLHLQLAYLAAQQGRPRVSRHHLLAAVEHARVLGAVGWLRMALGGLATHLAVWSDGDVEPVLAELDAISSGPEDRMLAAIPRGIAHLAAGRDERAVAVFDEAAALGRAAGSIRRALPLPWLAGAQLAVGDAAAAGRTLAAMEDAMAALPAVQHDDVHATAALTRGFAAVGRPSAAAVADARERIRAARAGRLRHPDIAAAATVLDARLPDPAGRQAEDRPEPVH